MENGCEESGLVSLNVGGVIYSTTRTTLTKYPDSMLGAMFNGNMKTTMDGKGNCFIDRDGILFRYILNFLRSGELCLPEHFRDLEQLEKEADFYQIQPLLESLNKLKTGTQKSESDSVVDYSIGYFVEIKEHPAHQNIQLIGPQGTSLNIVKEVLPKELLDHNNEKSKWGAGMKFTSQSVRLMYGAMLQKAGWKFMCMNIRQDNVIIEKWFLPKRTEDDVDGIYGADAYQ